MATKRVGWAMVAVLLAGGAAAGQEPRVDETTAPVPGGMPLADVEWAGLMWTGEGGYRPAPQLAAEVELSVSGLVARARVRQRFTNPGDDWMEGVYVFPLPENAAIDGLRMEIGGRVIEGQVREKEEAREVFAAARREGRRASLLEQQRPNVFTSRVTNVGPGETVEITIELQQAVDVDAGRMRLRFPTVVAPRFFPGGPVPPPEAPADGPSGGAPAVPEPLRAGRPPGGPTAADTGILPASAQVVGAIAGRVGRSLDALVEELRPEPPSVRVSLTVRLDAGFPLAELTSPSHPIDVVADGRRAWRVSLAGRRQAGAAARGSAALAADRDFELVWAPASGRVPRAALFSEEHEGDTYALLMVLPPEPGTDGWAPLAREVIFVLDTSGSMHGAPIEQARAALGEALARLEPWDHFNVIAFSDRARPLFPASMPADPAVVARAASWVAGLDADGGTDMRAALALALDGEPGYRRADPDRVRQVVFLTDGAVGNEEELFAIIAARLGDTRLFTVGIGSAPNGHFMRRAAEVGRGSFTWIGDLAAVGKAVEELARKLEGPVLTDLEVQWDDPMAETWPERLPDLYVDEPLVVAARLIRPGAEVRVSGRRGGVWWQETVPLEPVTVAAHAGVRQLWARRKIDHWLGRRVEGVAEEEVRRQILEVALAHHLVSRYTSLVAVDVTPVRPDGAALAAGAVALELPAGHLPVGGTSARRDLLVGLLLMLAAVPLLVRRRRPRPAAGPPAGRLR